MNLTGKKPLKLAAAILAILMAVQVPAIGANRQVDPGIKEQDIYTVNASSLTDAPAAAAAAEPAKAVSDEPAALAAAPAVIKATIETRETMFDAAAAETAEVPAQPAGPENAAAAAEAQLILPGVLYDAEEELLFGPNGRGLLYIGFDYDISQNLFYSSVNCWQKSFGYGDIYDTLAPLGAMFFDTRSIYFDYDGREWMFKLWKGQYGITSGAEVGLYTKSSDSSFYTGVDEKDFVMMDLKVFRYNEPYFIRDPQMHWWLSGFIVGDVSTPDDLNLETTITFKDQAMTDAFAAALGAKSDIADVSCVLNGCDVILKW